MSDETKNKHSHCHDHDCPSGKRNRYFKGKNMTADDFKLEQDYGIERRRLLNRAIHGWGVVYGFKLELQDGQLLCGDGLALDRHGRELIRAEKGLIPADRIKIFESPKDTKTKESDSTEVSKVQSTTQESEKKGNPSDSNKQWLLQAHYAERRMDEVRKEGNCGCSDREWNHVCETMVFSLMPLAADCNCGESPCQTCVCPDEGNRKDAQNQGCGTKAPIDRGPHDCLCQWLIARGEDVQAQSDELCCWEKFRERYRIAEKDAVPLACVRVTFDDCKHPKFESIDDACTPRRLVKNNDLLFDLFRGCDLTHIVRVSWADWHRKLTRNEAMPWNTFVELMAPPQSASGQDKTSAVKTNFWIRFSAPVEIDTLRPDCIVMTVFAAEDEGGWIEVRRVPITSLEPHIGGGCPDGFTDQVNICVDSGWCDDEIEGHKSIFHRHRVRVEIEVRGDLILDCHGQAVDANAAGVRAIPTGNGTPGGTYISSFRVAPKRLPEREAKTED